jgi:branched-chain amino acid transport system substrate-binding protein
VKITQSGSAYVFRVNPAGPAYEDPLIDALVKQGHKKFSIIGDNSAYGKGETTYQVAALERNSLKALNTEEYGIDDKDFTGQLTKILQAQPEVLLLASSEVAAGLIAKQARQLGFKGVIAGGAAIGTPKFIETAGDAAEVYSLPRLIPAMTLMIRQRRLPPRIGSAGTGKSQKVMGQIPTMVHRCS